MNQVILFIYGVLCVVLGRMTYHPKEALGAWALLAIITALIMFLAWIRYGDE